MNKHEKQRRRRMAVLIACGSAVVLAVFFLGNLFSKDKGFSDTENRMLAQKPKLQAEQVMDGRYGQKFETYYNDQFLLRNYWIKIKAGFDLLTGRVEENGVFLGKKGSLFEDFTPPQKKNLDLIYTAMKEFGSRHSNLKQYAMVVPNAVSVQSDKLPAFAPVEDQNQYLDEMKVQMESQNITFIDVRDTLKEHKKEKLYYQTDHHWTTRAAYYAYLEAGKALGYDAGEEKFDILPVTDKFQGTLSAKSGFRSGMTESMEIFLPKETSTSVVNYVDEQVKSASFYDTEKLNTRDGYACFLGGNHSVVKIQTPIKENKRILVLKDSYANCFLPFLASKYREIVVVDPRYYFGDLENLMQVEEIQEILYLYNANTFFSDTSLQTVINPQP